MFPNHLQSDYRKWSVLGFRIFLGGVFVWAAWVKIAEPQGFAAIIGNYQLLPGPLVNPLAVLLPWLEALCGVLLIVGAWVDGSLLIVNALMVVWLRWCRPGSVESMSTADVFQWPRPSMGPIT
jgi:uncharacterized membrane protein YphA (DoxX/SURF4 family)